jgi:hypothetical protein
MFDIIGQVKMFVNYNIKPIVEMHSGSKTNNILLIRKCYIIQIKVINIEGLVRSQYKKEKSTKNGREFTRKS